MAGLPYSLFPTPYPLPLKQARRDLNPQPTDLESAALSVGATGLCQAREVARAQERGKTQVSISSSEGPALWLEYPLCYLVSLWGVCLRQDGHSFLNSTRSGCFLLFLVVV